jgi:ABC-type uncharacterized transport system permease subunit
LAFEAITYLISGTLVFATPLLLSALGEVIAERAGIINLGLEGIMVLGSFASFTIVYFNGGLGLGILGGIVVGALLGLVVAPLTITLMQDQILAGLGVYFAGLGITFFLYRVIFGVALVQPQVSGMQDIRIPVLSDIPIIGPGFFTHTAFTYLAIILIVVVYYLFKTPLGLRIIAAGENPHAAYVMGSNVNLVRYLSVVAGSILAALSGGYIAIALVKIYSATPIISGEGFIAIGLVYFGKWRPLRTALGCFFFGGMQALDYLLQALKVPLPPQFFNTLPYVFIIVVLAIASRHAEAPEWLGKPFKK